MVACTTNTVYRYTFCNTFHNKTLSDAADDVVRFGVTRTLGTERFGLVSLEGGLSPGSRIVISVDKAQTWTFESPGNVALLVPPAESKKIIDQLLTGKTVRVTFTPAGRSQQVIEVSLATFPEALKRAREKAK
jgi:invasion protein IalB